MTDTNFECNILNICKGYFFEPEEGLRWLNKYNELIKPAFDTVVDSVRCIVNQLSTI